VARPLEGDNIHLGSKNSKEKSVCDESRIDLSKPKNWHGAIDLLRHLAELDDRNDAQTISQVLARALDAEKSIHHCSGGTWALVLISMVEHAVLNAKDMPQMPKN